MRCSRETIGKEQKKRYSWGILRTPCPIFDYRRGNLNGRESLCLSPICGKSGRSFQSVAREHFCALRKGLPSASEAARYLSSGDFYLDHDSRFHFHERTNSKKEMDGIVLRVHETVEGSVQDGPAPFTRVEIDPQGSSITAVTEVDDPEEGCWVDKEIVSLDDAGRIYRIDDVFTPIKDGEIMPSYRYTEIYMEGGGKVLMDQSGMGDYEAASARVYSEDGDLLRIEKILLPEGGIIDQIDTAQVILIVALPEDIPVEEHGLTEEALEALFWQQDSEIPDPLYADMSEFEI